MNRSLLLLIATLATLTITSCSHDETREPGTLGWHHRTGGDSIAQNPNQPEPEETEAESTGGPYNAR